MGRRTILVKNILSCVQRFLADVAEEIEHAHARGAVVSKEAAGVAREQASHMLRIGRECRLESWRRGLPLVPIATDRHALALSELTRGGQM